MDAFFLFFRAEKINFLKKVKKKHVRKYVTILENFSFEYKLRNQNI